MRSDDRARKNDFAVVVYAHKKLVDHLNYAIKIKQWNECNINAAKEKKKRGFSIFSQIVYEPTQDPGSMLLIKNWPNSRFDKVTAE